MTKASLADVWAIGPQPTDSVIDHGLRHASSQIRAPRPDGERAPAEAAPDDWRAWNDVLFPGQALYAEHHVEFWEHVWSIEDAVGCDPFVAAWSRGGGKSTSVERAVAALGLRGRRRYCWYVRETQERADDSIKNVQELLEDPLVERYYPAHAERRVTKYGHSKGWNSTRLMTAGGFTVEGIGLDTAARGLKIGDQRPDLIILDDLDGKHDSKKATTKKIDTLTTSVLPAGTGITSVLAVQNLIIPNGIFSQLTDGRADFLVTRRVSGPIPAVESLEVDVRDDPKLGRRRAFIVGGRPTWEGQNIAACQQLMDLIGYRSFLKECQHEVKKREGALWSDDLIDHIDAAPPLRRVVVSVDPSGGSAEIGIIVAGVGHDGRGYVLADVTQPGSAGPLNWGTATVGAYDDHSADRIVAERNFGGDMVESTIQVAAGDRKVPVTLVNASRGKAVRAEPVAALYEDGLVSHVGPFPELEAEMTSWVPGDPDSPNRLDALVWALTDLKLTSKGRKRFGVWFPGSDDEEAA